MNEGWLFLVLGCLLGMTLLIVLYPLRHSKGMMLLISPLMLCFAVSLYWKWGALPQWTKHLSQQQKQAQVQALLKTAQPKDLIEKIKARLLHQPDSAQGWFLLGRLYVSQSQWQKAREAYAKAHFLKPDSPKITVNYVECLWELNHQTMNALMRELLQGVLVQHENQPDALAMLAMDAFLEHAYPQAIDYWERLLNILPPQSDEAESVRKALAKAIQSMEKRHEGESLSSD
ncbi:MAG: hypothetical protein NTW94_04150 [Legionellales bacterium]|nr:hypothetical protein [Legionellales bacterium]